MPYDPEEQKEIRKPVYDILRRHKVPLNKQLIADEFCKNGCEVPREQLESKIYQCLMTYPEFKSVGNEYFVASGRTRQSFAATPKLESLPPEDIPALESMIAEPVPRKKQPPALRPGKKPGVNDPPPGPGLKDEVYTVVHDAGILMTRDQIVSEVLQRGNVNKYENIGSTIGFFLNSDPRYELVGICYRLRPEQKK